MNAEEIRFHLRDRWRAVEEIEQQELRDSTIKQNWQKLNAIMLRAKRLKLSRGNDNNEMEVFLKWAKIKEKYEASKRATEIPDPLVSLQNLVSRFDHRCSKWVKRNIPSSILTELSLG